MTYKVDSPEAEEFIHHEEILETLEYARTNKDNRALIEQLIEKAALCKGLTHREAAVLLECDQPDLIEHIFHLAKEIKQKFYGNRIVMFAPLYLSNYCVNGCTYCPYHAKNKTIARKKLTQEEIRREVIALQDMGHKRLAIEAGEEDIPAKVICQDGSVHDLLLHVKGLTADEKEILLRGCLMNYYAARNKE